PHEVARFAETNRAYTRDTYRGVKVRALYFPGVMAVGFLSNVAMIGAGAYILLRHPAGRFTLGDLIVLRGYWWQLFRPVFTLAQVNEMVQRARAAAGRIFEVLDAPEPVADAPDAEEAGALEGRIEFRNV